jgi:PIN domain nuclease of toxin-antitoxin system
VTERLLLDTHIALWLDSGDGALRPTTRALIDGCWQNGGTICISAVTVWEIALLVDTRRIELDLPIEAWIARFLERPGIEAVPLAHGAASRSNRLYQLEPRDPVDRLLARRRLSSRARWSPMTSAFCGLLRTTAGNAGFQRAPDLP